MEWNGAKGASPPSAILAAIACCLLRAALSSFGIRDPWELAPRISRARSPRATGADARPPAAVDVAGGAGLLPLRDPRVVGPAADGPLRAAPRCSWPTCWWRASRAGEPAPGRRWSRPPRRSSCSTRARCRASRRRSRRPPRCSSARSRPSSDPRRLTAPSRQRRPGDGGWRRGSGSARGWRRWPAASCRASRRRSWQPVSRSSARNELTKPFLDRRRFGAAALVLAAAILVALGTAHAIWADYAGFGLWTGGVARGGDPPTWEVAIEQLFHAFAPWSAVLPLALARMLIGRPVPGSSRTRRPTRRRYRCDRPRRDHPHLPRRARAAPRPGRVGGFRLPRGDALHGPLRPGDLRPPRGRSGRGRRDAPRRRALAARLVGHGGGRFLFAMLILRDYGEYPSGPIEGLPAQGIEVPEVFRPTIAWAALLGLFASGGGAGVGGGSLARSTRSCGTTSARSPATGAAAHSGSSRMCGCGSAYP